MRFIDVNKLHQIFTLVKHTLLYCHFKNIMLYIYILCYYFRVLVISNVLLLFLFLMLSVFCNNVPRECYLAVRLSTSERYERSNLSWLLPVTSISIESPWENSHTTNLFRDFRTHRINVLVLRVEMVFDHLRSEAVIYLWTTTCHFIIIIIIPRISVNHLLTPTGMLS